MPNKALLNADFIQELIRKLAPDPAQVAGLVSKTRKENPGSTPDEIAKFLSHKIIKAYTTQGAALALPGAIPGLGTLAQVSIEVGATTVDLGLLVRNQTYLTFVLGECYGISGRETLIADTLICIGLWSNALVLTRSGAVMIGQRIVAKNFQKRFSAEVLKKINRKVGTTILTKYGTKRGGIALGKLIPFGVGAVVGGGFNYFVMRNFSIATQNYLSLKLRGSTDTLSDKRPDGG